MASASDIKVLLLEDQALVRAGMRALIEISEPNVKVLEAATYDEALEILASEPIDIAFLDIELKNSKSGIDVLDYIRGAGLSTRAVMLSALADESLVMDCLRLGASGYIVKTMDCDGLFRTALDTVFGGGVFLPDVLASAAARRAAALSPAISTLAALEEVGVRGRAVDVLYYMCQGLPNQLIAHKMGLAESTIANDYNTRLFRQFRVTNRAALIVEVARRGLKPPAPIPVGEKDTAP